ncbi:MAG: inner membrane-spanning protein YciB [Gammaproteobacteria bacterium]
MRHWIAFVPAAAFFGVYLWTRDFHAATVALMIAVALQILLLLILKISPSGAEWLAAALILVFGGATLLLRETVYLQIKTTVINWLFALSLPVADFVFRKNLARALFGKFFEARDAQWRRASNALALMFFGVGAANLAVIYHLSEEAWVWTKTFVYPGVNLAGLVGVIVYLTHRATMKNDGR